MLHYYAAATGKIHMKEQVRSFSVEQVHVIFVHLGNDAVAFVKTLSIFASMPCFTGNFSFSPVTLYIHFMGIIYAENKAMQCQARL